MQRHDVLELREYQKECITAIWQAWPYEGNGTLRPAVVMPTGSGKTVMFSALARDFLEIYGERVLVLVHRDELADQAIEKIRATAPTLTVGKVKAADNEVSAQVVVASVQTLSRENRLQQLLQAHRIWQQIGLIITDECFPAGTTVGGKPIESLKVGDLVPCWNEWTGSEDLRPITEVMSRRPESLVRVTLDDGREVVCTPNHPILTSMGWCPAGGLWRGASVVSFTHDATADRDDMHGVRYVRNPAAQSTCGQLPSERTDVLLTGVPGRLGKAGPLGTDDPHQQDALRADFGAHALTEPDAVRRDAGEDVRDLAADRAQTKDAGRQRSSDAGAGSEAGGVPGLDAVGVLDRPGRRGASVPLQGGHRAPGDEGQRGGGRGVPFLAGPPSLRPAPGRAASLTGVAGVQVLEPGSDGTYGGVCPDGLVYNIAVDTTHTYLIGDGGLVVHNCHHAAAASYQKIYDAFPDIKHAGFTATLARGDGVGLGSVWEKVVYQRTVLEMVADGYLTDVRGRTIGLDGLDLSTVKRSGGDYSAGSLGDAMLGADGPRVIARVMREHAADRRSVVFTPTVAVAHATAKELDTNGIPAGVVSGETPREERLQTYAAFQSGRLRALVNCMVLTEGFDAPWADCCVIARPTQSAPLFVQMVGRVLRPWPGKKDALVLDVAGTGGKLSTLVDLAAGQVVQIRPGESLAEAYEEQERRADTLSEAGHLAFRLRNRELDLFAAASPNWLRTRGGVLFIPIKGGAIFLWPSRDGEGHWDVCGAPENDGKWVRLHEGLPLGTAQAWCETEARDNSRFSIEKAARWRKDRARPGAVGHAKALGLDVPAGASAGDVSDLISVLEYSRKFDPKLKRLG